MHTRSRYHWLPRNFLSGPVETLDVGFGNGALCYAAYKKGNKVLGIDYLKEQTQRTALFFRSFINSDNLRFQFLNAYELPKLNHCFDQIICSETLEHISNDRLIISYMYDLLKPGGILHLCCPNALHPHNNLGRRNYPEDGEHVRDGYTMESYASLLEPEGFKIVDSLGLGSPGLVRYDKIVRSIRNRFGLFAALPVFLLVLPFAMFCDKPVTKNPFSIYVKAVKISKNSAILGGGVK